MADDIVFSITAEDDASKAVAAATKALNELAKTAVTVDAALADMDVSSSKSNKRVKRLADSVKATNTETAKAAKSFKEAGQGARGFGDAIRAPGRLVKDLGSGVKNTAEGIESLTKSMENASETLRNFNQTIKETADTVSAVVTATAKAGFALKVYQDRVRILNLVKGGLITAVGVGLVSAFAKGTKAASDHHAELRQLGIQAGLTTEQFQRMSDGNEDWAESVEEAYNIAAGASEDWRIRQQEALAAASEDWDATTSWITDRWQEVKDFVGAGFEIGALSYGAVTGRANTETSNAAVARFAVEHGLTRETAEMILRGTGAAPANAGGPSSAAYLTGGGAQTGSAAITPGGYVSLNRLPPAPEAGGPSSDAYRGPQTGFGLPEGGGGNLQKAFFDAVASEYGLSVGDALKAVTSGEKPTLTPRPVLGGGGGDTRDLLGERSDRAFGRAYEENTQRAMRAAIEQGEFSLARDEADALHQLRTTSAQSLETEGERYLAQQQACLLYTSPSPRDS